MNNPRRKRIDELISNLENLWNELEKIVSEEEEYRDNIPENLQSSDRYYSADSNCVNLTNALNYIEDAIEYLGNSKE